MELEMLYMELKDRVQALWDDMYPEDIFPVDSPVVDRDSGAVKVAEIRKILKQIDDLEIVREVR